MAEIRPAPNRPTVGGIVGGILGIRDEIANPTPGNPVGPVGRAACRALASTGFDGFPLANRTGPGFICEPYWNDEGIDPPADVPPFDGGQCPGVGYRVDMSIEAYTPIDCDSPNDFTPFRNVTGPVRGIRVERLIGIPGPCEGATGDTIILTATDGAGNPIDYIIQGASSDTYGSASITSVTRLDGQPDTCGDPPPESVPGPSNPGTPYGSPISIPGYPDITFEVGPPEAPPGGTPYWPITIRDTDGNPVGPPIVFDPTGLPPNFPPSPVPPSVPGEPAEPSKPSGDVDDDISPEEEEEGFETIGYEWQLLGMPANPSSIPGTSPLVLTTPYGNVQLRIEGDGGTLYSDNLPIRVVSGSIVRQDPALKVKGVLYSRRPDVQGIRLTPIRARRIS